MSAPRAPLAVARAAVGLAVRPLPSLDDRLRYRAEFTADLSALPPLGQLRYATGVLSQTFALRAALGSTPDRAEESAMSAPARARVPFFRCRLLRWHRWVTRSTEDGDRYPACASCGRLLHDGMTRGPGSRGFSGPVGS